MSSCPYFLIDHRASPAAAVLRDTSRVASRGALARAVLTLRVALQLYNHLHNHLSVNQVIQDQMTLIHTSEEGKEDVMTDTTMKEDLGKSSRPVRNRRYTRLVATNIDMHDSLLSVFSIFSLCVTYVSSTMPQCPLLKNFTIYEPRCFVHVFICQ